MTARCLCLKKVSVDRIRRYASHSPADPHVPGVGLCLQQHSLRVDDPHSGHIRAGEGMAVRLIMWCPALAALATCTLFRIDLATLGWKWRPARYEGVCRLVSKLRRSSLNCFKSALRLSISRLSACSSSLDACNSSLAVCNSSFELCNSSLLRLRFFVRPAPIAPKPSRNAEERAL
jgi:hypothetical protein